MSDTQAMLTGLLVHARSGAEAEKEARQILAFHAHELAEKIRAAARERYAPHENTYAVSELSRLDGGLTAADLIDPEKPDA